MNKLTDKIKDAVDCKAVEKLSLLIEDVALKYNYWRNAISDEEAYEIQGELFTYFINNIYC
jgi:hypothetical protein